MDATVTQLLHVLELGLHMRALQRDYFRSRDPRTLRDALKAERTFDRAAQAALERVTQEVTQGNLLP